MTWRSLRLRFAVASTIVSTLFVLALGAVLQNVFETHVERAALDELNADLRFLTRSLKSENGVVFLSVEQLPDPRFQEPLSGLYWQIHDDRVGIVARSASLATFSIPLPADELDIGEVHRHEVPGPEGSTLTVLERRIPDAKGSKVAFRFAVAIDRAVISRSYQAFLTDLAPLLVLIGAGMLAASALQAVYALAPLRDVRKALQDVRIGRRLQIGKIAPSELAGLAADFDDLLTGERRAAQQARQRAADLAHGLKTPLAVLSAKARDLRRRGEVEPAEGIDAIIADLDARLSRELARAQIQGPSSRRAPIPVAPLAERVARALASTDEGDRLSWQVDIDQDLHFQFDASDLTELMGSIAHNACKWAKSRVRISAAMDEHRWTLLIEDDGPGVAPQDRRAALTRGAGLDPARTGSGLGLAIAQDIAREYGASLTLSDSPLGGLAVLVSGARS